MPLFPEEQNPQHRPVPTPEQQRLRQQRDDYHRQQQGGAYPVAPRPIPQQPPATRPSQGWTDEQTGYVQQGIQQSAPQPEAPEGWVLHPITGQLVKDPLYVPKAAEVVEEVKEAVTPKVSWLKWLPWILLAFLFLGGSIGGVAWSLWPDTDRERDDHDDHQSQVITNPGEWEIVVLADGKAALCDQVISRARQGGFKDWVDVKEMWTPAKTNVENKSKDEFKSEIYDKLQGNDFSNERVVERFSVLRDGYRQAVGR